MSSRIKACVYDWNGNLFCCGSPRLVASLFVRNVVSSENAEVFERAWMNGAGLSSALRLKTAMDAINSQTNQPYRLRIVRQQKGTVIPRKTNTLKKKTVPLAAVEGPYEGAYVPQPRRFIRVGEARYPLRVAFEYR